MSHISGNVWKTLARGCCIYVFLVLNINVHAAYEYLHKTEIRET